MHERTHKPAPGSRRWQWMLVFGPVFGLMIGLALLSRAAAQPREPRAIALREVVEVQEDIIRLSHLLPADAPSSLRQLSGGIVLGRSPLPGSVRVLEAAQIAQALRDWPELWHGFSIPDRVLVRRAGWTIQRAAVDAAIRKFLGTHGKVALPDSAWLGLAPIVVRERNPVLEVTGMKRALRPKSYELRLRCVTHAVCGSFLVQLSGVGTDSEKSAQSTFSTSFSSSLSSAAMPFSTISGNAGPWLAQSGKKAELRLDGQGMSMKLPVICLQRGRLGENIRVLDAHRHKVLRAQVVGPGSLQSNF